MFRTIEVARILGTSPSRVRRQVHAGVCEPTRKGIAFRFDFRDLVLLRAAGRLLASGVSARRLLRTLARVRRRVAAVDLPGLRFHLLGRNVIVHDGETAWDPEDGQLLLSFEVAELARPAGGNASPPTALADRSPADRKRRADDWFERGVALERADDAAAAEAAYRRALESDPDHGDAATNLGRLAHADGRLREASRLYRCALRNDPSDAVAHYNLALVLEDLGTPKSAIRHYRKAVAVAPEFADAHFNLARLYEDCGRHVDAVRHFLMYSTLTSGES